MALKNTKGIQPHSIKKTSVKLAPAYITARVLPGLKNTWQDLSTKNPVGPTSNSSQIRGLEAERAILEYYEKRNYLCLAKRLKTPFSEIDLLFWTPDGDLLMVEVKSSNSLSFRSQRITWKQKRRLQNSMTFLNARFDCLVLIHWAFVTQSGRIDVVEDVCS